MNLFASIASAFGRFFHARESDFMPTVPTNMEPASLGLSTLTTNQRAFLRSIAWSEGTTRVPNSDDGYRAIVGGETFMSYADHPRKMVWIPRLGTYSSAAGRYQLLERYFDAYKVKLNLTDFSPVSQDVIAMQQIRECNALALIESGDFTTAIERCAHIWASLPNGMTGGAYGQGGNTLAAVQAAYQQAGGRVA